MAPNHQARSDRPGQPCTYFTWAIAQTLEEELGRDVYYEPGNLSETFSLNGTNGGVKNPTKA